MKWEQSVTLKLYGVFCLVPSALELLSLLLSEPVVEAATSKSQYVGSLWLNGLYKAH